MPVETGHIEILFERCQDFSDAELDDAASHSSGVLFSYRALNSLDIPTNDNQHLHCSRSGLHPGHNDLEQEGDTVMPPSILHA